MALFDGLLIHAVAFRCCPHDCCDYDAEQHPAWASKQRRQPIGCLLLYQHHRVTACRVVCHTQTPVPVTISPRDCFFLVKNLVVCAKLRIFAALIKNLSDYGE